MAVFQILFGLTVFFITREYYIHESADLNVGLSMLREPSLISLDRITQPGAGRVDSPPVSQSIIKNPVEASRQADAFFTNKQFDRAADLYAQLLAFDRNNVDTYNNLGLTLHYLGRSTEALAKLNEGVAVDPTHQRIWLTLGFVNGQLGNAEQARTALTTAVQMGADNTIGQAAKEMLEKLP